MNNGANEETLKNLHKVLLEMMDVIDRICRDNNISYFLDSGTALGAIRHGGFIPWDDDLDIGMLRKDYDRFCEIAPKLLPPDLILQNSDNEPYYYLFYSRIRKVGTYYPRPDDRENNFKCQGIPIDIFPFDYVPDNKKITEKYMTHARYLRKVCEFRLKGEKRNLINAFGYSALRLLPKKVYRSCYDKVVRKFDDRPTNTVASFTYRMGRKKNYYFHASAFSESKDIPFEDRTYMIMKDPDHYLKIMYGDYMRLPPVEQREYHVSGKVVF